MHGETPPPAAGGPIRALLLAQVNQPWRWFSFCPLCAVRGRIGAFLFLSAYLSGLLRCQLLEVNCVWCPLPLVRANRASERARNWWTHAHLPQVTSVLPPSLHHAPRKSIDEKQLSNAGKFGSAGGERDRGIVSSRSAFGFVSLLFFSPHLRCRP
jgi:hypothetical protein